MRHIIITLLLATSLSALAAQDTIRLLCIGNSFSHDAVEQELAPICKNANQPIIIGNLCRGGCSLEKHHRYLMKDTAGYSFRYIEHGQRNVIEGGYSLRQALKLMKWDYISLQQVSTNSGIQSTYEPYLQTLIDTIKHYQPQAQLCWMQTWSYSKDSKHRAFPNYQCNQQLMDDSIHSATLALLARHPELLLVPCGRAITLARQTKLGDTLCRDGYHLNLVYGRYTAALVWFEILTGRDCRRIRYANAEMTAKQKHPVCDLYLNLCLT